MRMRLVVVLVVSALAVGCTSTGKPDLGGPSNGATVDASEPVPTGDTSTGRQPTEPSEVPVSLLDLLSREVLSTVVVPWPRRQSRTRAEGRPKPGPRTTGVPDPSSLSRVPGGLHIIRAHTVVEAADITGPVVVDAPNVTITGSKIHGSGESYGIFVRSGSVAVVDSELWGFQNGIAGDNWSAIRVDLHGMSDDGVKLGSNVMVLDSWIHSMEPGPDSHADGAQMQSGSRHVLIRHSVIDMGSVGDAANAALFLAPDLGPNSPGPVTIDGNWLNGGNFTLACLDGDNGAYVVDNIWVLRNRFGPDYQYGPLSVRVPVTLQSNVFDATGAPVSG